MTLLHFCHLCNSSHFHWMWTPTYTRLSINISYSIFFWEQPLIVDRLCWPQSFWSNQKPKKTRAWLFFQLKTPWGTFLAFCSLLELCFPTDIMFIFQASTHSLALLYFFPRYFNEIFQFLSLYTTYLYSSRNLCQMHDFSSSLNIHIIISKLLVSLSYLMIPWLLLSIYLSIYCTYVSTYLSIS